MWERTKMKWQRCWPGTLPIAAALNIGGDHISSQTEEDRFLSIREVYKENNFDLR